MPSSVCCLITLDEARLRKLRGREIVLVPQGVSYLDPLMRVGAQLNGAKRDPDSRRRTRESLARYGLGEEVERMYPFELSGGMARRVMIAAAVRCIPKLVIADDARVKPRSRATDSRALPGDRRWRGGGSADYP